MKPENSKKKFKAWPPNGVAGRGRPFEDSGPLTRGEAPQRSSEAPGRLESVLGGAEVDRPALRLVGVEPESVQKPLQPLRRGKPITEATDPRWVLAMRATALMEGPILRPEHRRTLQKLARVMGLSSFECNLIIAIVQDRARRGLAGDECPDAALEQLALVRQPPGRPSSEREDRWARAMRIGAIVTALLAMQLLLIWWAI
ncbi:MAG: hypothetical protein IT442_12750 [Phycisphaeraceae bacterium]|nr:hypothetical protein [Phycisphaeraceae bacterium]